MLKETGCKNLRLHSILQYTQTNHTRTEPKLQVKRMQYPEIY